jgi:hypothetical protein
VADAFVPEPEKIHRLRNQMAVVVSFAELVLLDTPDGDPRRADLLEIQKAAHASMTLLSEIAQTLQSHTKGTPDA